MSVELSRVVTPSMSDCSRVERSIASTFRRQRVMLLTHFRPRIWGPRELLDLDRVKVTPLIHLELLYRQCNLELLELFLSICGTQIVQAGVA